MTSSTLPLVSIVVIGRNEGARLARCLRSVLAQHNDTFCTELLYVDSGSTDGSQALATRLGAQVIPLRPDRPTAALGRNSGWQAAAGDFILFLDGDTVLHPDFTANALQAMLDPAAAVVWGHRRELYPQASVFNRVLDLDWIYPPGLSEFCGGDALFRREILLTTTGFDPTLIAGEEPELCRRILAYGKTIVHLDAPMTGHDLAITRFAQYWKRATRAGHAFAEVSSRFAAMPNPFWQADCRRNRNRALTLLLAPLIALAAAAALRSLWPLDLLLGSALLLVARTAWKARWKTPNLLSLALYGIHSHFQQIPIYFGQLQFGRNHRVGRNSALVEYKS